MSIFRVYVDGNLFYRPELSKLAITQAKVHEDAENIDSLTLSAPHIHPYLQDVVPLVSTRDQYLYLDRHEAIISVEQFESVQILIENRKHHIRGGLPMMHVIDEGIFRGFIPINHHWVNDDPGTYYDISNSVKQTAKVKAIPKRKFSAFDLKGYQVVRGQFLQIRYEGPTINISKERISFNKFCVQRFENVAYVQLLLHPTERRIAIRPCSSTDAHSIRWRPYPEKPVYSKTLNCQHFGNALYSIMGWNPDYIYKIRGT